MIDEDEFGFAVAEEDGDGSRVEAEIDGIRTAPTIGTAKWSSYMAGVLGAITETTWPLWMPMEEREEAS